MFKGLGWVWYRCAVIAKFACFFMFISACSSGGGKGGNSSGNDGASGGLSLMRNNVAGQADWSEKYSKEVRITGSVKGVAGMYASYVDVSSQVIEDAAFLFSDRENAELVITFKQPEGIAPGLYQEEILVKVCFDFPCTKHVPNSPQKVKVSYTVTREFRVSLAEPLDFDGFYGYTKMFFDKEISIFGAGSWTADVSNDWIVLDKNEGAEGNVKVNVLVDSLPSGTSQGSISFRNQLSGETRVIPLMVSLEPPEVNVLTPGPVVFRGAESKDFAPQDIELAASRVDGQLVAFDASRSPSWLQGGEQFINWNVRTMPIEVTTTGLTEDFYEGNAHFIFKILNEEFSASVPVQLHLDPQRIAPSDPNVAFVRIASHEKIRETLKIETNRDIPFEWVATIEYKSGQSNDWLAVHRDPSDPYSLILTVDESDPLMEGIYSATVNIQAVNDRQVELPPTQIAVGLYIDDVDAQPLFHKESTQSSVGGGMVADPVRPYIYVSEKSTYIDVYHVYTGDKVARIEGVGSVVGGLAISDDGTKLYALDYATANIRLLDISSISAEASFLPFQAQFESCIDCNNPYTRIKFTFVNSYGRELLFGDQQHVVDAKTGEIYGHSQSLYMSGSRIVPAGDGKSLYSTPVGISPSYVHRYRVITEENNAIKLVEATSNNQIPGVYSQTDFKGSRLYGDCTPYGGLAVYDAFLFEIISTINVDFIGIPIFAGDNKLICMNYFLEEEFAVINLETGLAEKVFPLTTDLRDYLEDFVISGDKKRIVVRGESRLYFVDVD